MTDQFMDTISNKEHERLLLMSEHAIAPPLSPATEAVLEAYMNNCGWLDGPFEKDYRCAAAVLRAAVKHCVPDDSEGHWVYIPHVLDIATELENL